MAKKTVRTSRRLPAPQAVGWYVKDGALVNYEVTQDAICFYLDREAGESPLAAPKPANEPPER